MEQLHDISRCKAIALASLVMDLPITQVVNSAKGIHAVLADGAFQRVRGGKSS